MAARAVIWAECCIRYLLNAIIKRWKGVTEYWIAARGNNFVGEFLLPWQQNRHASKVILKKKLFQDKLFQCGVT